MGDERVVIGPNDGDASLLIRLAGRQRRSRRAEFGDHQIRIDRLVEYQVDELHVKGLGKVTHVSKQCVSARNPLGDAGRRVRELEHSVRGKQLQPFVDASCCGKAQVLGQGVLCSGAACVIVFFNVMSCSLLG